METRLEQLAEGAGIQIPADAASGIEAYLELLARWGARMNLTADPRRETVMARQLPDALQLAAELAGGGGTIVDAGAGAGLVAIPVALLCPELRFTLVEANQRKCAFLRMARHALGLRLEVRAARIEEIEERFAIAMSRATWSPERWASEAQRLVAEGGRIVVFSREEPCLVGLERVSQRAYRLEDGAARCISIWGVGAGRAQARRST